MFISCLHAQQPQSIKQFISKLSRRTALNYIQHMCTGWVETAESQTPNQKLRQIPTNFLVESRERDGRKWMRFSGSEVSWLCEDSVR